MADVFRSREVYKRINTSQTTQDSLVPVRGVYVVGEHVERFHKEPSIFINNINTTKADIADFEIKNYIDNDDESFIGFKMNIDIKNIVQRYSTKTYTGNDDKSFIGFKMDIDKHTSVKRYESITDKIYDPGSFIGFNMDIDVKCSYRKMPLENANVPPQPAIRITKIETVRAMINNS